MRHLRSGFTAIELARAMANRIQELLAAEPGTRQGDAERRVGSENGMSDRRVRQFVALLTLSPQAQELAQQARLTENSLRQIVGIKDATSQLVAIRELMHPDQPRAKSHRRTKSGKRTHASQNLNRNVGDKKRRQRDNRESSIRRKRAIRKVHRQTMTRVGVKQTALRNLMALARLFREKELRLSRTDWKRAMETETDRNVLVNLHNILGHGLAISKGTNEKGSSS